MNIHEIKIEVELLDGSDLEFEYSVEDNEVNFVKKTDQGDELLSEEVINYNMFAELDIHPDMSEEDIFHSVQKAIGEMNFVTLEVQIELEDGSEISYDFEKQNGNDGNDDDEEQDDDDDEEEQDNGDDEEEQDGDEAEEQDDDEAEEQDDDDDEEEQDGDEAEEQDDDEGVEDNDVPIFIREEE